MLRRGLLLLVAGALIGCSSHERRSATGLEVTREDGSRVEFANRVRAWCGRFDDLEAFRQRFSPRALHIVGGEFTNRRTGPSVWKFSRAIDSIRRSPTLRMPEEAEPNSALYVWDAKDKNGLMSDDEATGKLTVKSWSCRRGATVRISVDGTLDSNYHDLPSARVKGEVEAVIGDPLHLSK